MLSVDMEKPTEHLMDQLTPLIKIIKDREGFYFQLLAFVIKNFQSTSEGIDQITIFGRFVQSIQASQKTIFLAEQSLIEIFPPDQQIRLSNIRQIIMLSSRILEIQEASLTRARKTIFNENGRIGVQFVRFKKNVHKMLRRDTLSLHDFVLVVITYSRNKYQRQVKKITSYIQKLQSGNNISLKQIYHNNVASDNSPDEKSKILISNKVVGKKIFGKLESPTKSLKKNMKNNSKRYSKKKNHQIEDKAPTKQSNANKLLKFYAILQLNKKQFLEDYIYEANAEEQQKKKIVISLLEKNKLINQQINTFVKKTINCVPETLKFEDNAPSARKQAKGQAFVISKRKLSFSYQATSNPEKNSDLEVERKKQPFHRTLKNFSPKRKSTQSHQKTKKKKMFMVQVPIVFKDDLIFQGPMANSAQWVKAPMTGKGSRTEHIRLKSRNNPLPMQNAYSPQTFRNMKNYI